MFFDTEMCYNLSPVTTAPPQNEWTEERRKKASEKAKEKGTDHMRTPEAIERMKEAKMNNPLVYTDKMRKARSLGLLGNTNKKGKKESEETRKRKTEASTGRKKPKQTLAMTGRTWWVNSEGKRKFQLESPGPEWQNGVKWSGVK